MDARNRSEAVRRTILDLVGRGCTVIEIHAELGPQVDETDLRYADSLVRVRDAVRSEKPRGLKPAASGA
jgi:hypothetical protein